MKHILSLFSTFLIAGCASISSIDYTEDYQPVAEDEWRLIKMDESTFCSDSSQYYIFSKKAASDNLIVHFIGGGACWDYETCAQPFNIWRGINVALTHNLKSFYIPSVSERMPKFITGLFENDDKNPFKDWNVVLIPYCTADMQVGNTTNNYISETGDTIRVHHNGSNNVQSALDWVYEHFDTPKKLLVTGDSAGGFATMLYANSIQAQYPSAKTYQLIDCAYMDAHYWQNLVHLWEAQIPFDYDSDQPLMEALFLSNINPEITYLQVGSLYDFVLAQFNAAVDSVEVYDKKYMNDWSKEMMQTVKKLTEKELDYRYFITDYKYKEKKHDTPHTFIGWSPSYYKCEQDGTPLYEWIAQNIIKDEPSNVGSQFLQLAID